MSAVPPPRRSILSLVPAAPATSSKPATLTVSTLAHYGVDARELFGSWAVPVRAVERVDAREVTVALGLKTVRLPREHFGDVKAGQWVRFGRVGDEVKVSVDLPATLKAEARLANLFSALV